MTSVVSRVKFVGRDKYKRACYQYTPNGTRYCGKDARRKAIQQGYAKQNAVAKLVGGTTRTP